VVVATAVPSIDELLDEAPLTRLHIRVWLLSAMGIMLDGFDFFIIGVAIPLITVQFGATTLQVGLVSAAAVIGAIFGASTLGPLTDRLGRRIVFMVDLAMFVAFAAGSALAWSIWVLIGVRFLLGVCIGADYPISAAYLAEISPRRSRTRLLVGAFTLQAAGQLLGALVGLVILEITTDVGAWRWMLAAGIPPAVLVVFLRLGVPESPRWLASKGRIDEAAAVTARFVQADVTVDQVRGRAEVENVPWRTLFALSMRARTALASVPWFLMDIATYGVGVFTPTILAASPSVATVPTCSTTSPRPRARLSWTSSWWSASRSRCC
jgi:MFS family permease